MHKHAPSFDPAKLRAARAGYSLTAMAEAIKTTRYTLARWERGGAGEPNATQLARIAEFTGRSLRFFYRNSRAA